MYTALLSREDWSTHHVYMSGPAPFVAEMSRLLPRWGVRPARLAHDPLPERRPRRPQHRTGHAERFLDPRPAPWIDPAAREPAPVPRPVRAPAPAAVPPSAAGHGRDRDRDRDTMVLLSLR